MGSEMCIRDRISISLRELLRVWWPVALIAVGVALFFTPGNKSK